MSGREWAHEELKLRAVRDWMSAVTEGIRAPLVATAEKYGTTDRTIARWRNELCSKCGERRRCCVCQFCDECGALKGPEIEIVLSMHNLKTGV